MNKIKFDNKNIEWLLYVLKRSVDNNTEKENEQVNMFFEKLMKSIGYKTVFYTNTKMTVKKGLEIQFLTEIHLNKRTNKLFATL